MNTGYSINSTGTTVDKIRRKSFSWGLKGYRPATSEVIRALRSRQTTAYIEGNSVRDEARWLALYCTDEDYTIQFLMQKTGLRRAEITRFCAHYNVDLKTRNLVGGLN